MTTAYTPILKLALPVTGELNGTWGTVVNDNITSMVEQAVAGLATINTWTTNSHTLTSADGTTSESRCAMLVIDDDGAGNPSAAATVICPTATKSYIVRNICGQTVTVKTSAGTGVAVPNNQAALVFCDGTNVVTGAFNGDVVGPASAVDNAIARFDLTTGKLIQNSGVTIDDSNNVSGVVQLNATTIDTTNLEVTNLKAKDGTAAGSIADSTGIVTLASSVLTTTDINGGTIDGTVIGGASAAAATVTSLTDSGNLTFTGTGNRITGDFTGSGGIANRVAFQTSTANSATNVQVMPNGTSVTSLINLESDSALTNGTFFQVAMNGGIDARIASNIRGTGTYLPMTFYTGGSERFRIDTSGNVGIGTSSPVTKLQSLGAAATTAPTLGSATGGSLYLNNTDANYGLLFGTGISGNSWIQAQRTDAIATAYNLLLNPSGGSVGIGTSSPVAKLDINGSVGIANRSLKIKPSANAADIPNLRTVLIEHASNDGTLSLGFSTSTDAWVVSSTYGSTGAYKPLAFATSDVEKMRLDTSGNLLVGNTATTGSTANNAIVLGGILKTISGSVSAASGTATTLYTAPSLANGTYIVSVGINSTAEPAIYSAVSLISVDSTVIVATALKLAVSMSISVSGQNVQATQASGITTNIVWTATRVH